MAAVALTNSTLSSALSKTATRAKLASAATRENGMLMCIGKEICLVNDVTDIANGNVGIQRGYAGTYAVAHASGAVVWTDKAEYFSTEIPQGTAVAANEVALPRIVLPSGNPSLHGAEAFRIVNDSWVEVPTQRLHNTACVDPDTGYEYILVDCQSSFLDGEWAVVDPDGLATQLASTSKGRVAIIVETVSASDTLSWALVVGSYASTNTSSGVTTAADLIAGTGTVDILTSTGGNIVWGAACTTAPSTATSPGLGGGVATVYVANPWVSGEVHSFSSVGT